MACAHPIDGAAMWLSCCVVVACVHCSGVLWQAQDGGECQVDGSLLDIHCRWATAPAGPRRIAARRHVCTHPQQHPHVDASKQHSNVCLLDASCVLPDILSTSVWGACMLADAVDIFCCLYSGLPCSWHCLLRHCITPGSCSVCAHPDLGQHCMEAQLRHCQAQQGQHVKLSATVATMVVPSGAAGSHLEDDCVAG